MITDIFLTGDTHGKIDIKKVLNFNKKCYLIILGDFGLTWYTKDNKEYEYQEYLLDEINKKPFITLFIDGNHENFTTLNKLPEQKMFGGNVGMLRERVIHLKRNQIYKIANKSFYVHGGGLSIDKHLRIEGISWWREELPTTKELNDAFDYINGQTVDYILTHEAPATLIPSILGKRDNMLLESQKFDSPLAKFFDYVYKIVNFKHWYCGHYHKDITLDNLTVIYNKIIKLE